RSPRLSARSPWRPASICWAARRGDSTTSHPGTRLDVRRQREVLHRHATVGGRGALQRCRLPRTGGAQPVHLLAPSEDRVPPSVQFRRRPFHRHCPLHLRALGRLFVVPPMALRNALSGYLRSPVTPGGGGDRLAGTHPGSP